jgi:formamidopyrimidine-DNA glycosylase
MPEGPEVWILNEAICRYYGKHISNSIGKHLIVQSDYNQSNNITIWSFGLNGTISIDENNKLYKPTEENWIFGKNKIYKNIQDDLALSTIDYMSSTLEEFNDFVNKLSKFRGKLGPYLINQNKISGIGVAWGSEILHRAGLRPDDSANHQDLSNLANIMIEIREEIKKLYESELNKCEQIKDFIEGWFENLYKIRNMKVYKVGEKINIGGRTWWI